jgi:hypothetical protein
VVKIWLVPTREELALFTQAARKLGVSASQFVRDVAKAHKRLESPKIPPQSTESPGITKLPRQRRG